MINIGNSFVVDSPIDTVWAFFDDVKNVGASVPTCKSVIVIDDEKIDVIMRIVLGIIPLENKLTLSIEHRDPPTHLIARGISYAGDAFKGIKVAADEKAVVVDLKIDLHLSTVDGNATRIEYEIAVEAFGAIKKIYEGIIRGKRKMIEGGFVENVGKHLGAEVHGLDEARLESA